MDGKLQLGYPMSCARAVAIAAVLGSTIGSGLAGQFESRASIIARAQVWHRTEIAAVDLTRGPAGRGAFAPGETVVCGYLEKKLDGHSQKFACRISPHDDVKVKYGGTNGEVYGEVAATRLLWALGFGADRMYPVRVICRGCPEHIGEAYLPSARVVDPAVIERKLAAREMPPDGASGWSWNELDLIEEEAGGAPRAHRDALKLLAVMLQHTDSKPEQQRLVCLDGTAPCARPLMMISDLGLTFGRANLVNANAVGSVNLRAWTQTPVWKGSEGCVGNLPKSLSGTLKDPPISDEGRGFLASLLLQLSDAQLRDLFKAARVEQRQRPQTMWPDLSGVQPAERPASVDEWVEAFKNKRQEIVERRCIGSWSTVAPPTFSTGPILWLQSRATPGLTLAMNIISLLGYSGIYMAIGFVLALGYRLRAGAALMIVLALTSLIADGVKTAVSYPRPAAVDSRVQAFSLLQPHDVLEESAGLTLPTSATKSDALPARVSAAFGDALEGNSRSRALDDGGFPSGHVAAATAFFLGLVFLFNWRWAWTGLIAWVFLMALSRMYLGRHFLGDVLGGFATGVVVTAGGLLALVLGRFANPRTAAERAERIARRSLLVAVAWVACALSLGVPDLPEAARLLGIAIGVVLISRDPRASDDVPRGIRAGRLVAAAILFPLVLLTISRAVDAVDLFEGPLRALLVGAVPVAVVLPGAVYAGHLASAFRKGMIVERAAGGRAA